MAPFPTDLWPPIFANRVCDKISISRKISVSNVTISNSGSPVFASAESRDENDTPLSQSTSCARYMLFGVNLANSHLELPSLQVATYCEPSSPCSFPPTFECVSETIEASESTKNSPGVLLKKQCEDCCVTNRSCTKVLYFLNCLYTWFEKLDENNQLNYLKSCLVRFHTNYLKYWIVA